MTKPTRDAVEEMLNDFEAHELIGSRRDVYELVVRVLKDWLAQDEELSEAIKEAAKWRRIRKPTHGPCCTCQGCGLYHDECRCDLDEVCDELDQLKTENQALKASMEAEYIERQAKHIQELVKENGELKATRVEWQLNLGIVPPDKEGQPLHYTADDATGDEGNEGGQP